MHAHAQDALCPLDGRYLHHMRELSAIFSESALIKHRYLVELIWLETLAQTPAIAELPTLSADAIEQLKQCRESFGESDVATIKSLEARCNHDVKSVEYHLKNQLGAHPSTRALVEWVHFACTSEDINNLAYAMMVREALHTVLLPAIASITEQLSTQAASHANLAMLARTHGQPASPTTLGKEIANVVLRLKRCQTQLASQAIFAKCNGAVGNYNAHALAYPDVDWPALTANMISKLGLTPNSHTTQIEPHDGLAALSHTLCQLNNILLDYAQDTWQDIARGFYQLKINTQEVGSSTMPHKVNPIDFENAEGNLGLANALLNHFASKLTRSRWQRDLSDSTVLRNVGVAFGYALLAYRSLANGIAKVRPNSALITQELSSHWEVLTEAVQTMMRKEGLPTPYQQLKALSRGKGLSEADLAAFIRNSGLSKASQDRLLALTPGDYTGLAEQLAKSL